MILYFAWSIHRTNLSILYILAAQYSSCPGLYWRNHHPSIFTTRDTTILHAYCPMHSSSIHWHTFQCIPKPPFIHTHSCMYTHPFTHMHFCIDMPTLSPVRFYYTPFTLSFTPCTVPTQLCLKCFFTHFALHCCFLLYISISLVHCYHRHSAPPHNFHVQRQSFHPFPYEWL